jgi:hypothetical protein
VSMDNHHRGHPSLSIISSSFPARPISTSPSAHRQSQSPFRYIRFPLDADEKDSDETLLCDLAEHKRPWSTPTGQHSPGSHASASHPSPTSTSRSHRPPPLPPLSGRPSPLLRQPPALVLNCHTRTLPASYTRPRGLRIFNLLRPWIPIILYALTNIGFVVAIACFKNEVFTGQFRVVLQIDCD